ncbi:hypothetical protein Enr13x_30510 [Stieleria neptunia]|uniref:Uncharacterized protein n=1 Tax=Stieleria neptunia TaxID=2527979 RepID=A0A518HQR4_9BACT|nr:hypothetical protein [Stieleria neptunia]QDV43196.1 hypothetical protein Enr13x_30510 [Stieleria neptunia]
MRRTSLGILILGGGILFSLPFRKPTLPDASAVDEGADQRTSDRFDDASIEMLVREVTEDVQVPVVYDPRTDYSPPATSTPPRQLPLTYQDLAVPVDRDPFYETHFNATTAVASQSTSPDEAQRLAELERVFAATQYVDQSIAGLHNDSPPPAAIAPAGKQWVYQNAISEPPSLAATAAPSPVAAPHPPGAQLASSPALGQPARTPHSGDFSVLSQLPPPDDQAGTGGAERPRHWIRQPD